MTYSPDRNSESACTRALAASRVCAASTKCNSPSSSMSPSTLRMQKGRRIQAPNRGTNYQEGQQSDYGINLVCWVWALSTYQSGGDKRSPPTMGAHFCKGRPKSVAVLLASKAYYFSIPYNPGGRDAAPSPSTFRVPLISPRRSAWVQPS